MRANNKILFSLAILILLAINAIVVLPQHKNVATSFETIKFHDNEFDIVKADLTQAQVRLYWRNAAGQRYGKLSAINQAVKAQGLTLFAATNAGIFTPDFAPEGLYIERGVKLHDLNLNSGTGNFYLQPNGVFLIGADGAQVVPATKYNAVANKVQEATQSGPMLVIDNQINSLFTNGSTNKVVRSGVGIISAQQIVFAISRQPVNFYDFALLFRDQLHCRNALYLDGHISKLYKPDQRTEDGDFAGIIAIVKR